MTPESIAYHSKSKILELSYADGSNANLTAEYLRVFSPSAEVRGHSESERKLQAGKKHIEIENIEPIGNYAIRIIFSDGHDTGIYSYDYLVELRDQFEINWTQYEVELKAANASRLPTIPVGQWKPDNKR